MDINTAKGFTLIEVMVAMLVLAFGVLGLGVLQLSSLQTTQSGQMRSQGSILTYDILDNMRANTPAVTSQAYHLPFGEATPQARNCYGPDVTCTSTEMAVADLEQWRESLAARLPSGNGQVLTADAGTGKTVVAIWVSWADPYNGGAQDQIFLLTELPK